MSERSSLDRLRFACAIAAGVIVVAALLSVTVLTGWSAMGRRIPGLQVVGIHELTILAGVWLYFIGGGHATTVGRNIDAGLGYHDNRKNWAARVRGLASPLAIVTVSIVMASLAWEDVAWHLQTGRLTVQLRMPAFWSPLAVVVGFALMAMAAVLQAISVLRDGGSPDAAGLGSKAQVP